MGVTAPTGPLDRRGGATGGRRTAVHPVTGRSGAEPGTAPSGHRAGPASTGPLARPVGAAGGGRTTVRGHAQDRRAGEPHRDGAHPAVRRGLLAAEVRRQRGRAARVLPHAEDRPGGVRTRPSARQHRTSALRRGRRQPAVRQRGRPGRAPGPPCDGRRRRGRGRPPARGPDVQTDRRALRAALRAGQPRHALRARRPGAGRGDGAGLRDGRRLLRQGPRLHGTPRPGTGITGVRHPPRSARRAGPDGPARGAPYRTAHRDAARRERAGRTGDALRGAGARARRGSRW